MPIINKGVFDINSVYLRDVGNDWPTAQVINTSDVVETTNLYFTNARTINAVTSLLTTANVVETDNLYFTNARTVQTVTPLLTTANVVETDNLYFTNTRVLDSLVDASVLVADLTAAGNISANGLVIRGIVVNDNILSGNVTITNITNANVISANIVSSQIWQGLYTSNVIETSPNLYFSNARARGAFIGGRGIVIQDDGVIKSTVGTETFNTEINGTQSYVVTDSMSAALTMNSTPVNDRYIIRSMHVTNVSDAPAFVSANVLYATGNTAVLATRIPVPVGGILEFMDKPQLLQPNDRINVQGFNSSGTPTSNLLHATFAVEQITNDITYYGTGLTLPASNTNILLVNATQSFVIFESIKFVNLKDYSVPVRLLITDANNTIKSYLAYNTQVPPNSSLEILQTPKNLAYTDKLYAQYSNASEGDAISVFTSYRYSSITNLLFTQSSGTPGETVEIDFSTTLVDGTTLYYTLE